MQLVYSTAPVDWADLLGDGGESYSSAEMQAVYSKTSVDCAA